MWFGRVRTKSEDGLIDCPVHAGRQTAIAIQDGAGTKLLFGPVCEQCYFGALNRTIIQYRVDLENAHARVG